MTAFILMLSMTVDEAKAKHHAYIACLRNHNVKYCNVKYQVKS